VLARRMSASGNGSPRSSPKACDAAAAADDMQKRPLCRRWPCQARRARTCRRDRPFVRERTAAEDRHRIVTVARLDPAESLRHAVSASSQPVDAGCRWCRAPAAAQTVGAPRRRGCPSLHAQAAAVHWKPRVAARPSRRARLKDASRTARRSTDSAWQLTTSLMGGGFARTPPPFPARRCRRAPFAWLACAPLAAQVSWFLR
jgi:hypothetical protein